jgi:hypothetical protein
VLNHIRLLLTADALLPIRILAFIALMAVIASFIYVLLHLQKIERTIAKDYLVPRERGPRNNMVLIICAVPIVITTLLLFLIFKA